MCVCELSLVPAHTMNSSQKFYKAVKEGDLPTIRECVQGHVDVNTLFSQGNTALGFAIFKQHVAVVEYLSHIADINKFSSPSGRPASSWAVKSGRIDILKFILKKKPHLNIVDTFNDTPLLLAINNQPYESKIVQNLINAGADINFVDAKTPLTAAVENNNLHIVKELVELGADVNKCGKTGYPPLLAAVFKKNLDIVKYLVSKGANINAVHTDGSTCLSIAVNSGSLNIAEYLIGICGTSDALFLATKYGHLSTVKYLISKHDFHIDDSDSSGNTALTVAIKNRQDKVADFFISCKADVCKFVSPGQSPLVAAVETKNIYLIYNLLQHGARPSIHTAFRKSIEIRNFEIVKLLKQNGANVNMKYRDGSSPITIAANTQDLDIIKFLLQQGAYINEVDGSGRSPLSIAASNSSFQIVKFLLNCKADLKLAEKELESFASWHEDVWCLLEEHKSNMAAILKGFGNDAYKP